MGIFGKIIGGIGSLATALFGSSSNGKGIVTAVSDTVDKWHPSAVTEHKMALEDLKAGDESQDSARKMQMISHDSWFDILVDGLNRLVRPLVTYWLCGGIAGFWPLPATGTVDPLILNAFWTVITFWFGGRVIVKDIPKAIATYAEHRTRIKQENALPPRTE